MTATPAPALWTHPAATPLPFSLPGPFVLTGDRKILTVDDRNLLRSTDEGSTWVGRPLFDYGRNDKEYKISNERVLLLTRNGTLILSFMNLNEKAWLWRDELGDILPGTRLPHYVMRSLDGGETFRDVTMLHEAWTGEIRNIIETKSGKLVLSSMRMLSNPGRHAVLTYVSGDDGVSWKASNVIDLGGAGHHGGVTEATVEELTDGRIIMFIRTNWGKFWRAISHDDGESWRDIAPSEIDASSAPGLLKRLSDGTLVLVWNRYFPEGATSYPLRGGDNLWSEVPVSNHREELSVSFSTDDASTWSPPVVVARQKEAWLSYPRLFERRPGELWLTTMQGALSLRLDVRALRAEG